MKSVAGDGRVASTSMGSVTEALVCRLQSGAWAMGDLHPSQAFRRPDGKRATAVNAGSEARVQIPAHVSGDFEVFLNGVRQVEGRDYRRDGSELVFEHELAKEGRLGTIRWLSMLLGIAGTYRKNDSVDVVYESGGKRLVATDLPIVRA